MRAPSNGPISLSAPGVAPQEDEIDLPAEATPGQPPYRDAPAYPPRDRYAAPPHSAPYSQAPASAPPRLGPAQGNPVNTVGPVAIKPTATLACPIVSALDRWLADSVQPAAQRWFGARVVEIKQISAYSCRGMNGNSNAHISEHAFGNALDIAAFTLADGRRITVKDGWKGMPEEQGFLRDVQGAACQQFNTVLAPGSNVYHYDHIHVDLMRRASRRIICQPAAVSGEEIAARAGGRNPYASREPYRDGIARRQEAAVAAAQGEQQGQRGRRVRGRVSSTCQDGGYRFAEARPYALTLSTPPAAPADRARRLAADRACSPSSATAWRRRCACSAALAMFAAFAGLPCSAASTAASRSGTGAMPPAVRRMNWNVPSLITARAQTSTSGHSAWVRLMARL